MSTKKPTKKDNAKAATNGSATATSSPSSPSSAAATGVTTSAKAADDKPALSPEAMAKIAELRGKIQTSVGQVVLAMMNLPRYRNQSLGDLTHLVLEPLLRDRLAIASARPKDSEAGEVSDTLAGIAIWASVDDSVDGKIREQIKSGAFPVRLTSEDWVSGEKLWLLDVIAPNRKLATSVLANFSQVAKDRPVSIHPIVARSVDPELLKKMKARPAENEPVDEAAESAADAVPELSADTETKGEA